MQRSKWKQLIVGLLLGAMLVGGISAFAFADQTVGDDPPVPYFTDEVLRPTPNAAKSARYDTKYNPKKPRITNVKVFWYAEYYDRVKQTGDYSLLHVDWKAKKGKTVKRYEVQLGLDRKFLFSEYMTTKYNSVTLRATRSTVFKPLLRSADSNTYYIRVRAHYKKGKPSKWSKIVTLTPKDDNQMTLNDYRRICNIG